MLPLKEKKKKKKRRTKKKLRDCMVAQTTQRNVFLLSFFGGYLNECFVSLELHLSLRNVLFFNIFKGALWFCQVLRLATL